MLDFFLLMDHFSKFDDFERMDSSRRTTNFKSATKNHTTITSNEVKITPLKHASVNLQTFNERVAMSQTLGKLCLTQTITYVYD